MPTLELIADVAILKAQRDAAEKAISDHNEACLDRCGRGEEEGVRCKYRPYFPRRCPECPRHEMIDYTRPTSC
jgi:hypothetical protein